MRDARHELPLVNARGVLSATYESPDLLQRVSVCTCAPLARVKRCKRIGEFAIFGEGNLSLHRSLFRWAAAASVAAGSLFAAAAMSFGTATGRGSLGSALATGLAMKGAGRATGAACGLRAAARLGSPSVRTLPRTRAPLPMPMPGGGWALGA